MTDDSTRPIDLPNDVIESVMAHMNDDHADAVAAIGQAFGKTEDGASVASMPFTDARITHFASSEMTIMIDASDSQRSVLVLFDPPIADVGDIRQRLMDLTRRAREANTQ